MSFIIQPIIHVKLIRIGAARSHHRAAAAANKKFVAPATRNSNNEKWVGIIAIVLTFVLSETVVVAQQPKKFSRIGYLSSGDAARDSVRYETIRLALRERGDIEGQNIASEYRYAEGKVNRFSELAAELVHLKVDIIVVSGGNRLVLAAKDATKTIPIVMTGGGTDPVEAGLVESLARPGGNVTGITNLSGPQCQAIPPNVLVRTDD